MGLISRLRTRKKDIGTLTTLLGAAEAHALRSGDERPGAHHLLLAALELPDGSALRALARVGADRADFARAIDVQYEDALRGVGISIADAPPAEPPPSKAFPAGDATLQAALRAAHDAHTAGPGELLGAHIVLGVAEVEHGVAARAIAAMGVSREDLAEAARAEIAPGAGGPLG